MDLKIEWLAGLCPVQAEGTVNGKPFYFRARHEHWEFMLVKEGDPVDAFLEPERRLFYRREAYGRPGQHDAGYMPEKIARQLIQQCAVAYDRLVGESAHSVVDISEVHE